MSAILANVVIIAVSSSIGERWDFVSAKHHVMRRTESSVMILLLIVAGIQVDALGSTKAVVVDQKGLVRICRSVNVIAQSTA